VVWMQMHGWHQWAWGMSALPHMWHDWGAPCFNKATWLHWQRCWLATWLNRGKQSWTPTQVGYHVVWIQMHSRHQWAWGMGALPHMWHDLGATYFKATWMHWQRCWLAYTIYIGHHVAWIYMHAWNWHWAWAQGTMPWLKPWCSKGCTTTNFRYHVAWQQIHGWHWQWAMCALHNLWHEPCWANTCLKARHWWHWCWLNRHLSWCKPWLWQGCWESIPATICGFHLWQLKQKQLTLPGLWIWTMWAHVTLWFLW
jgi:hypothetical protein